jgi:hypothetical protein
MSRRKGTVRNHMKIPGSMKPKNTRYVEPKEDYNVTYNQTIRRKREGM